MTKFEKINQRIKIPLIKYAMARTPGKSIVLPFQEDILKDLNNKNINKIIMKRKNKWHIQ